MTTGVETSTRGRRARRGVRTDGRTRRRVWDRDPLPALGILVGIVAWEVVSRIVQSPFVPSFTGIVRRLGEMTSEGLILGQLAESLLNLAIALLAALVVGITVGVAMGVFPAVRYALDPYVNTLLTAPALLFGPIYFGVFGFGRITILALIFQYSVFIVIINVSAGVRSVREDLVEMALSYGAKRAQVTFLVLIPSAMPLVMAGVRVGAGRAVKGMINGEMFIALSGLGFLVATSGARYDVESVLAVMLVVIVVAVAVGAAASRLDKRLTRWVASTHR